jgi:hypothetical protein
MRQGTVDYGQIQVDFCHIVAPRQSYRTVFGTTHSDAEIAAVANYIISRFSARKAVTHRRARRGRPEKANLRM